MTEDEPKQTLADLFNLPRAGGTEFEGKVYPIRQPTLLEQAQFSRWLEGQAYASVARMVHLPEAERAAHRKGVRDDAAAGEFEYGGFVSAKSLATVDGIAMLRSITLQADGFDECDHAFCVRMTRADVEAGVARLLAAGSADPKVRSALEWILGLMGVTAAGAGNPNPKSAAPTSPTSGS